MTYLLDALQEYAASLDYPFHMPGHKRRQLSFPNPYTIDITEIDDFDNLHHAEGLLKEAQERAAALYGSQQCYYLVNGSTCGLLAAICAATQKKDKVIVARNCHKAVYHALALNELHAEYLYPQITANGIQGQITAEQVKEALAGHPDASAVILTSPTYEGIVSDVKSIAELCHDSGIPLIVDEAHGAHFGFGGGFPENAIKLGADAVIMSVHKTLPAFTQTALLHLNTSRIDVERVKKFLGIFETSSPSYVLMAGIDECIRLLEKDRDTLFAQYRRRLDDFYRGTEDLRCLHVMNRSDLSRNEAFDWDDGKLVMFSEGAGLTGEELHELLWKKFHLQMEMVSGYYVLGMTSLMDTEEGLKRLCEALHEIDREALEVLKNREKVNHISKEFIEKIYQQNPKEKEIYEAEAFSTEETELAEAEGKISAGTVFLYPPGIPMIVPGERITAQLIENIKRCLSMGLRVEGVISRSEEQHLVLCCVSKL